MPAILDSRAYALLQQGMKDRMGEHADDYFDSMLDPSNEFLSRYDRPIPYQRRTGRFHWRDMHGEVLDMHNMSTQHLENAAAYCRRNGNTGKMADLLTVLEERGPSAELADLRARTGE